MQQQTFTVWFYIGCLLTLYGCLLTAAGAYQVVHPPPTVLASYHATLWAGIVLLLIGGTYLIAYWPRSSRNKDTASKP
jgi:membrane protein DedA with SNARE-associated domain